MTGKDDSTTDPYPEKMSFQLKPGTLAGIDSVLRPGETREDFVRAAAETALRQRLEQGKRQ